MTRILRNNSRSILSKIARYWSPTITPSLKISLAAFEFLLFPSCNLPASSWKNSYRSSTRLSSLTHVFFSFFLSNVSRSLLTIHFHRSHQQRLTTKKRNVKKLMCGALLSKVSSDWSKLKWRQGCFGKRTWEWISARSQSKSFPTKKFNCCCGWSHLDRCFFW